MLGVHWVLTHSHVFTISTNRNLTGVLGGFLSPQPSHACKLDLNPGFGDVPQPDREAGVFVSKIVVLQSVDYQSGGKRWQPSS